MWKADCRIFVTIMITVINCLIIDPAEGHVKIIGHKGLCAGQEELGQVIKSMNCRRLGLHPFQLDDHVTDRVKAGLPECL